MIKQQDKHIAISCYPFGVGNNTEGVAILLQIADYSILLDCGLKDISLFCQQNAVDFNWVFCSHAHDDHAYGLLSLHQHFSDLPIYTSKVTAKLLPLNWLDKKDKHNLSFVQIIPWRSPLHLTSDLTVELYPSGHLPGAASFLFKYHHQNRVYQVFYTGDFCLSNLQLVEGLSLDSLRGLSPDVLIIEGTYGTARHPHRRQQEKHLMTRIKLALANGANVILPVPILGLGQELLKLLRSHHEFTGKDIDIWVDGNLPTACDLYLDLLSYFPDNVQNFAKHQPLFWDEKIKPRMHRVPNNIDRHQLATYPSVVLTDKLNHLQQYCLKNEQQWLILVPEQSKINQSQEFKEFAQDCQTERIIIEDYLLAEHSDGRNTTQLIHNLRPQHVVFIHGSSNYLADLTSLEELQNRYQLHSPSPGVKVDLPVGSPFIQPKVTAKNYYEGELNETGAYITISLPEQINRDPRWQNFADTGLVEARWQGDELILRGLSQRELLQQNTSVRRQINIESCGNCRYYQEQVCRNKQSPLHGYNVPIDGYCPLFESLL